MNMRLVYLGIGAAALFFVFVPDPLDVITAGLPIIEGLVATFAFYKGLGKQYALYIAIALTVIVGLIAYGVLHLT